MDRPNPAKDARHGNHAVAASSQHEFFSYITQEVQKPISGIIGMIDLLKGTAMSLEQSTYTEMIRHNADRLMTLLTNIIDMSRLQSESMPLAAIDFDLRMMLKDISRHISVRAAEKFLAYQYTIHPNVASRFKGDPGRIRQILCSVLDNAVKYTSEGGVTLHVETRDGGGGKTIAVFEVTDTGIGISEARRDQLFASFTPARPGVAQPSLRTGISLSIAKQLCEMMGGDLHLESRLGEGCSVTVTVRLETPSSDDEISPADVDVSNLRVLVADDSPSHRNTLEKQLSALGCRWDSVPNGWRALEALKHAASAQDPFHIAIVDPALPDMSGATIGEKIKQDPSIRDTRLMMIAVIGKRGDARKYQEIGFSAYLLKPLKPAQLIDSLRMVMGRRPARPSEMPPEIITRHTLMEKRKQGIRILFVEPDATMQVAGCGLLKNLGYHSDPVQSMEEALLRMEYHAYDMVITEMMTPELDGCEMIRRIREMTAGATPASVPVLCLVSSDAADAFKRAMGAGGDAILPKPFGADELERMIEPLLKHQPPSDEGHGAGIFDDKWLREQLGDNEEMIRALIKGFMEKTPAHLRKLKEHTRAKNAEQIREIGNIIKGTSSVIGAHGLYKIAFQIEVAGQNAAYSVMPALIQNLEKAMEELTSAMEASPFVTGPLAVGADPVNMKIVLEIFNNNQSLLERFFSDFMVNSLETMAELRSAVTEKNADQVRRSAHKLKGSLRYLAADKAIDAATHLEELGREAAVEGMGAAFDALTAAYEEVRHFITERRAAGKTEA